MVARTRASVVRLVDHKCRGKEPGERLRFMALQVMLLAEDPAEQRQLARFVFVLIALELHASAGGLRDTHVAQLLEIGHAILAAHDVTSSESRLGFLLGELRAAKSAIAARSGDHWRAAVHQYGACYFARASSRRVQSTMRLDLAQRALRLGQASGAITLLTGAEARGLGDDESARGRLLFADALRIAGRHTEIAAVLAGDERLDALWQKRKAACAAAGDYRALQGETRRGKAFYTAAFLLETTLLLRCADRIVDHTTFPKLSALVRRRNLDWRGHEVILRFARALEEAHEPDDEVSARIERVGLALGDCGGFQNVEHEMLAHAAAARWLARMNAFELAAMALGRYQGLCLAASDGRASDSLGVAGDLLAKPWFARPTTLAAPAAAS